MAHHQLSFRHGACIQPFNGFLGGVALSGAAGAARAGPGILGVVVEVSARIIPVFLSGVEVVACALPGLLRVGFLPCLPLARPCPAGGSFPWPGGAGGLSEK